MSLPPLAILGRGLVSALGADLAQACAALREGLPPPAQLRFADGSQRPYRALHATLAGADWADTARRAIEAALAEAGCTDRTATLLLASSSRDGSAAVAAGEPFQPLRFTAQLRDWLDWQGPIFSLDTACTSSMNALLTAQRLVASGQAREVVVLGVELDARLGPAGFHAMQMLTATQAQAFGAARDGMLLGEAVAVLRVGQGSRWGESRWRLLALRNVVDGSDPAGASQSAIEAVCRQALAQAGVTPAQIGLIKVQASGSPANDATEARALLSLFPAMPPLLSLKSALGHCLGAAGAAEIALLCAAQESATLPLVAVEPDPALGLGLCQERCIAARYTLLLILGFGGGHAAAILEDREAM